MRVESERAQADRKLWCANRSAYIDLTQFYEGKSGPVRNIDIYFPFSGQPTLLQHLRPALEGYAGTIGEKSLIALKTYLNSFFTFLTQERPNLLSISDVTVWLIAAHGNHLNKLGLSQSLRASFHSYGNGILRHLHARFGSEFPNLSRGQSSITYPRIRMGTSLPRRKLVPIDLEPYIRRYCLQVLNRADENPFLKIKPEPGADVMNPAHVLYDFLYFQELRLRGEASGSWRAKPVKKFPWRSLPHVSQVTSTSKELSLKPGNLWCGGSNGQMWEALFPTTEEIVASVILVTLDVGWVDTAKAFTFKGQWYSTLAKDPNRPTTSDYVALIPQIRPKTFQEVWSKAAHVRVGGSWWVLRRIQKRTERLRALCRRQAVALGEMSQLNPSSDTSRLDFERWQHLANSSFIFYGPKGPGSAVTLDGNKWSTFLRKIPKLANFGARPVKALWCEVCDLCYAALAA